MITTHYGLENQKRKLIEEIYELLDAEAEMRYSGLNYFNKINEMIEHIAEELADCYVLLEQHRIYWGINREDIKKIFQQKVDRQLGRMKNE